MLVLGEKNTSIEGMGRRESVWLVASSVGSSSSSHNSNIRLKG